MSTVLRTMLSNTVTCKVLPHTVHDHTTATLSIISCYLLMDRSHRQQPRHLMQVNRSRRLSPHPWFTALHIDYCSSVCTSIHYMYRCTCTYLEVTKQLTCWLMLSCLCVIKWTCACKNVHMSCACICKHISPQSPFCGLGMYWMKFSLPFNPINVSSTESSLERMQFFWKLESRVWTNGLSL